MASSADANTSSNNASSTDNPRSSCSEDTGPSVGSSRVVSASLRPSANCASRPWYRGRRPPANAAAAGDAVPSCVSSCWPSPGRWGDSPPSAANAAWLLPLAPALPTGLDRLRRAAGAWTAWPLDERLTPLTAPGCTPAASPAASTRDVKDRDRPAAAAGREADGGVGGSAEGHATGPGEPAGVDLPSGPAGVALLRPPGVGEVGCGGHGPSAWSS